MVHYTPDGEFTDDFGGDTDGQKYGASPIQYRVGRGSTCAAAAVLSAAAAVAESPPPAPPAQTTTTTAAQTIRRRRAMDGRTPVV